MLRQLQPVVEAHLNTKFIRDCKHDIVAVRITITSAVMSFYYLDRNGCQHNPMDMAIDTDLYYTFFTSLEVLLQPDKQCTQDKFELTVYQRASGW